MTVRIRENPVEELKKAHVHWKDIYENGTFDNYWPDGLNLNLVRNHMLYYQGQIVEIYGDQKKPDIYYELLPDIVEPDYMAQKDEIIKRAVLLYERYTQMDEVNELIRAEQYLSEKEMDELLLRYEINSVKGLEKAIQEENYVMMRAMSWHGEDAIQEKREAYDRLMNRDHVEAEQMSLFEMTI